jgi:DNA-binding CsgD family transcriptional regulator
MSWDQAEPTGLAGHLAAAFASLKALGLGDRAVFNGILRSVLLANPRLLGVWTVWEPDALDGRDREFAGSAGHDGTGRFVPFWHRKGGGVHLQPNTDYDKPCAHWYLRPSRSGKPTVIDPYEYGVGGETLFIASQVAPVFDEGRCAGVVGVDVHLNTARGEAPDIATVEAVLDRGYIVVDRRGAVRHWSDSTRSLLQRYVGRGEGGLPAELSQAIRRRLSTGGAHVRTAWKFSRSGRHLVVRLVRHPHADCHFLLVEEQEGGSQTAAELSPREQEVARWMGRGKSNEEIAIILGISAHTVKNHLEKVFRKLGVENRHAASLALQAVRPEVQAA